jgi:hypothetical protein
VLIIKKEYSTMDSRSKKLFSSSFIKKFLFVASPAPAPENPSGSMTAIMYEDDVQKFPQLMVHAENKNRGCFKLVDNWIGKKDLMAKGNIHSFKDEEVIELPRAKL